MLRQRIVDTVQHGVRLRQHIVVPIAQDAPTALLEIVHALVVISDGLDMLTSIEFDDNAAFRTRKISNEQSDRMLAAEFPPGQCAIPQVSPQQSFGIGLISTKRPSPRCCVSPHPSPLPKIGERECLRATARALSVFRLNA